MSQLLSILLVFPAVHSYRPETLPCRAHFQCLSGYCDVRRECSLPNDIGDRCTENEACSSFRCSEGVCQIPLAPDAEPCVVDEDCWEGYCGSRGVCQSWLARGEGCERDEACETGRCTRGICTAVVSDGGICERNADCHGKRCIGGICNTRKPLGGFCNDDLDCLSLRCDDNRCNEPVDLGGACDEPSDCYSLLCHSNFNICVETADLAGPNPQGEPERPEEGITGSGYTPPPTAAPSVMPSESPTNVPSGSPTMASSSGPNLAPTTIQEGVEDGPSNEPPDGNGEDTPEPETSEPATELNESMEDSEDETSNHTDTGDNIFDHVETDDGLIDENGHGLGNNDTIIDMNNGANNSIVDDTSSDVGDETSSDVGDNEDSAASYWPSHALVVATTVSAVLFLR